MAHLNKQKQEWQGNNFQNQQFKQDDVEDDSQYDEDFEQEEVLGDDHDIYGFEDDNEDDEYYEGYGNGSGDFDNGIDASGQMQGRSSAGSSQFNDPLALRGSNKKNSSGYGNSALQTTA